MADLGNQIAHATSLRFVSWFVFRRPGPLGWRGVVLRLRRPLIPVLDCFLLTSNWNCSGAGLIGSSPQIVVRVTAAVATCSFRWRPPLEKLSFSRAEVGRTRVSSC